MEIFNTKTRKKEIFKALKSDKIKIYYCGPTVYNYAHIGNLRTFVFEDIIVRTFKFLGERVETTMNLTDVDDKTIRDSQASGEKLEDFTKRYTEIFLNDIKKLNIVKADNIVPVTTLIPEMIRMINTMLKRKNAYLSDDGSIYFKVSSYKKYGKFANIDLKNLKNGVRVDNDEYDKDNFGDFVLWKAYKIEDGENFWEEEFEINGKKEKIKGRPGWHIECSACNMKYFGQQIDIHMGGEDLIFPHHQNEIAQTESCTRKEFSKYWMHSGHLMVDGKKMSKSLGNFYTLEDLEKKYSTTKNSILYRAIRLSFISGNYRDSIDFSFKTLEANINVIKKIDESIKNLVLDSDKKIEIEPDKITGIRIEFRNSMQEYIQSYIEKLENDFDTVEAIAVFHSFIKFVNTGLKSGEFSYEELQSVMDMFETFNEVLAIVDFDIIDELEQEIPEKFLKILEDRDNAKKKKDFDLADTLRNELTTLGYKIVDSREGSRVEKI